MMIILFYPTSKQTIVVKETITVIMIKEKTNKCGQYETCCFCSVQKMIDIILIYGRFIAILKNKKILLMCINFHFHIIINHG